MDFNETSTTRRRKFFSKKLFQKSADRKKEGRNVDPKHNSLSLTLQKRVILTFILNEI